VLLLQFRCSVLSARPMTESQAETAVAGWLQIAALPFHTESGSDVSKVETYTDDNGEPIYYVVCLQAGGYVIVSADNQVEPIIGFVKDGTYDPSDANPLGALVTQDLQDRVASVQNTVSLQMAAGGSSVNNSQSKWNYFISLGESTNAGLALMGLTCVSDVRVTPLIKSKWGQRSCCTNPALYCYNYYTPQKYPCGCVATALAQLMRYYQYPSSQIGANYFAVEVDEKPQSAFTRGGDGFGGAYNWPLMSLDPNCSTTVEQRDAIGVLCYDAGISVGTMYGSDASLAEAQYVDDALIGIFQYGGAVNGFNSNENIGSGLIDMINPNLDAGKPVILSINRRGGGHAVLCDGYSYVSSTMYHHLNMGWNGGNDAWYNLPVVDTDSFQYTSINECIYNIHVTKQGDGEIISGRIFDNNGQTISGATVYAEPQDCNFCLTASSDENGIYAFDGLDSNTAYTIRPQAGACVFAGRTVTTGISQNDSAVSGNIWGVDFTADYIGDFDSDGDIDSADFAVFSRSWHSRPEDDQWNPDCDISSPADDVIDALDLAVFVDNWQSNMK